MTAAIVKMIMGLGIVFVLLFFLARLLKRTPFAQGDPAGNAGIRVLTTKPIASRKYISLVEIGGDVFALGVSETQINLLTKIENKEFIEKVTARRPGIGESFSLSHYFPKGRGGSGLGLLRIFHGK